VLVAAEQRLTAPVIATIVRVCAKMTKRCATGSNGRWPKGSKASTIARCPERRPKSRPPMPSSWSQPCLRRRPRSLGQPSSLWTLQRRADYLAEQTGLRLSDETVRLCLQRAGIVLSRPQHTSSSSDPEYAVKTRRSKTRATA